MKPKRLPVPITENDRAKIKARAKANKRSMAFVAAEMLALGLSLAHEKQEVRK